MIFHQPQSPMLKNGWWKKLGFQDGMNYHIYERTIIFDQLNDIHSTFIGTSHRKWWFVSKHNLCVIIYPSLRSGAEAGLRNGGIHTAPHGGATAAVQEDGGGGRRMCTGTGKSQECINISLPHSLAELVKLWNMFVLTRRNRVFSHMRLRCEIIFPRDSVLPCVFFRRCCTDYCYRL